MSAAADLDWRQRGACRDDDPELFFPVSGSGASLPQIAEAKAVCWRCPVRPECLEWSVVSGQRFGIWGGLTEQEHRRVDKPVRVAVVQPPPQPVFGRVPTSAYHAQIAEMRTAGLRFADIADRLGLNLNTLKAYWYDHGDQPVMPEPTLVPLVHEHGRKPRPSEHRDLIIQMLTDTSYTYTYKQVAYVLGCTPQSVKSYWLRTLRPQVESAERDADRLVAA